MHKVSQNQKVEVQVYGRWRDATVQGNMLVGTDKVGNTEGFELAILSDSTKTIIDPWRNRVRAKEA